MTRLKARRTRHPSIRPGLLGWLGLPLLLALTASCMRGPRVEMLAPDGKVIATVRVEIANTPAEQRVGLMYRKHLDANAGMIFVFPSSQHVTFWMKNTEIPLDMIFADGGRDIIGIVREARPFSTNLLGVKGASRYVIEVNGGFCRRHRVEAGDHLRFIGF